MPNQLHAAKRRQSFIDDKAMLDALAEMASREERPVAELIRDALRLYVKATPKSPETMRAVRAVVSANKPQMPATLKTPASVARFKEAQRAHDALALALGVETPESVQARNSVYASPDKVRVLNFSTAHTAHAGRSAK
jgi:hypothetical protein